MNARAEILARIAAAASSATDETPRLYRGAGSEGRVEASVLDLMQDRLVDYKATVRRIDSHPGDTDRVAASIGSSLAEEGVQRLVVPAGFPQGWIPAGVTVVADEPPLTPVELDSVDGVLTICRCAIAETGTIVLDGGAGQGRRALSLIPDYHLVVIRAEQILASVPDAVAELDPIRAMTWISGPSATSDIELQRVEGVHGPRRLEVLVLVSPESSGGGQ